MKKIISALLVYFIFVITVSAQENVLEVLSVKGNVLWKISSKGNPRELLAYQRLLPADQVIIRDTACKVRFINNRTKLVAELGRVGQYSVSTLLNGPSWRDDLKNFISLILNEVKPDTGYSGTEGGIPGGITRGLKGFLYPPDQSIIIRDEITFKWNRGSGKQKFLITKDKRLLMELCISDASLTLSTKSDLLNQPGIYKWKGSGSAENVNPSTFIILSDVAKADLQKEITAKKSQKTGNEMFDLLELAKFYIKHNLFIEAESTYMELLKVIQ
ncbi:MAG: hypothetical protein ACOYNC_05080 [Bacteroidales bacterium]